MSSPYALASEISLEWRHCSEVSFSQKTSLCEEKSCNFRLKRPPISVQFPPTIRLFPTAGNNFKLKMKNEYRPPYLRFNFPSWLHPPPKRIFNFHFKKSLHPAKKCSRLSQHRTRRKTLKYLKQSENFAYVRLLTNMAPPALQKFWNINYAHIRSRVVKFFVYQNFRGFSSN